MSYSDNRQNPAAFDRIPPPALPVHDGYATPSPTPTVETTQMDDYPEKVERNYIPGMIDQQADVETLQQQKIKKRRMADRNCCVRCMCCACCLPLWATGILWFIIISIIIIIIVIGAIAATFIMPTVDMAGVSSSPTTGSQISFSGDGFNINFGLIVAVNNPNLFSIDLTDITATAYYTGKNGGESQIGGGYLAEQFVPKYSNFNFTFPFAIQYNPNIDTDQSMLMDIADKCGLTGGEKQDITVRYTIHLTAKVLVIKVHPTISSSATFACPLDNGGLSGLGDGTMAGFDL